MRSKINLIKTSAILLLCLLFISLCGCLNEHTISDPAADTTTSDLVVVLVTEVVDGDTITISGGERVRLIGIDAPELDEDHYQESKLYLTNRILQKKVKLEGDVVDKGRYGRSLRYVWLDGELINAEIVREGLAIAKQYDENNNKYQHLIADAEKEAIENRIRIWSAIPPEESYSPNAESADLQVISYLDAGKYIGKTLTVEGTVVGTFKYTDGDIIFLNFHDPYKGYFTVMIWSDNWDRFPQSPDIYYDNKKIRVTGEITQHDGSPEMVVSDISQIEIIHTY
jgi:micrococcal nuclease